MENEKGVEALWRMELREWNKGNGDGREWFVGKGKGNGKWKGMEWRGLEMESEWRRYEDVR